MTAISQPRTAMARYGLAYLGAHLAFMPLLVLLVPRRVESLAPGNAGEWLSWLLLCGACVAGLAHILAGHASDRWLERHGRRRGMIAIGAVVLAGSYIVLSIAQSFAGLMTAILLFQLALNIAFAPLGALLADHFPHSQKGQMGGLMNAALPASSLAVVLVGWLFPQDGNSAFLFTGALACACLLPLLVNWGLGSARTAAIPDSQAPRPLARVARADFSIAWAARLAVQLGSAFVHGYIYLYLAATLAGNSDDPRFTATSILSTLSAPAAIIAIAATIAAGTLSDKAGKRRFPLSISALAVAAGLLSMAQADGLAVMLVGYVSFYVGLSAFLSIDTALVAQLVSANRNRGTLLGIMNLTNTLPSVIAPGLTLLAYQQSQLQQQLSALFMVCAALALAGAVGIQFIQTVR